MAALSRAMIEALAQISQSGGHGYGEFAYLGTRTAGTRTAEALERRGLVILGYRSTDYGKPKTPWAIAVGAEATAVHGWISQADNRAEWNRGIAELNRRRSALRSELVEEIRASRVAAGKVCDSDWESKLRALISAYGTATIRAEWAKQVEAAR